MYGIAILRYYILIIVKSPKHTIIGKQSFEMIAPI